MSYTRVNWNSTTTYVSAENLNAMDKGIKDLDTNVGNVTTLTTAAKTVVPAINEIKTGLDAVNNNLDDINYRFNGSIDVNDANQATSYGVYTTIPQTTNIPVPTWGILIVEIGARGSWVFQTFKLTGGDIYTRQFINQEWSTWVLK